MRLAPSLATLAAACGLAVAGGQTTPAAPAVICQPCGETPPPRGFSCFGKVMIADTVTTAEAPKVAAGCTLPTAKAPAAETSAPPASPKKACGKASVKKKKSRNEDRGVRN